MIGLIVVSVKSFSAEPFLFTEILDLKVDLQAPEFISAFDKTPLAYYKFADSSCDDIVILYAGAGLYGNHAYQWIAQELYQKHQIGCYVFDLRGHGHSGGARGDAPSANAVLRDVQAALDFVQVAHPKKRVHLAGHSSGAGLVLNFAKFNRANLAQSYILLAPYLGPKSGAIRLQSDQSKSFVKNVRTWVYLVGAVFSARLVAHVPTVFFNYPANILNQDPLIVDHYTYAMSCATTPYELSALFAKVNKPTAIYIGSDDEQFVPEKVISYKGSILAPCQAKVVEGAKHLSILAQAPQLIAEFVNQRLGFTFRSITEADLPMLWQWLAQSHVRQWWPEPDQEEFIAKFLERIRSKETFGFVVSLDRRSMGYIQYYHIDFTNPKTGSWLPKNLPQTTVGIDQLIGMVDLTGKGYGTKMIQAFLYELKRQDSTITTVIVDPDPTNVAAIRCYERVGFRQVGKYPTAWGSALLMRYDF